MTPAKNKRRETGSEDRAFVRRLRLRAQRRVLWMRALWAGSGAQGTQGLAITDAEVDRILQHPRAMTSSEAEFYKTDQATRDLTHQIVEAEAAAGRDPCWTRLTSEFNLSVFERDLLSLAVTVEIDPWWRRVCGYLHDDATAAQATLWLAAGLFGWDRDVRLGPDFALVRWQLARPADNAANPWSTTAPWQADPHIVTWLLDGAAADPLLGAAAKPSAALVSDCLYPDVLAAMRQFADSVLEHDPASPVAIELIGPEGSGRQTLAAQLAAASGKNGLIVADGRVLLGPGVPYNLADEHFIRAVRSARLSDSILYWRNAEAAEPRVWSSGRRSADHDFRGHRAFSGKRALAGAAPHLPSSIAFPKATLRFVGAARRGRCAGSGFRLGINSRRDCKGRIGRRGQPRRGD